MPVGRRIRAGLWAFLVVQAVVVWGCWDGSSGRQLVHQGECVTCHLADYQGTDSPRHEGRFPTTCADCHSTDAWIPALGGANDTNDPARDVVVHALIPRYSGTTIVSVTPQDQTLHMTMVHGATARLAYRPRF